MSGDDLIQLLIAVAVIFFWLLGGKRKRQTPSGPSGGGSRRPQPRPAPRREVRRVPVARPQEPAGGAGQASGRDTTVADLYAILTGERPPSDETAESWEASAEAAAAEPRSLEQVEGPEAVSLETLEPAGEVSHRRFYEKYVAPEQPAAAAAPGKPRVPRLRQAILWREILGPPKGW
ncbi:MAG: hypothetical protein HYV20_12760 [Gemmatimonadetes bacterium]|nr:hypothetical protein [Gemmatimonadota bacterium]